MRSIRPLLTASGLAAALALTATACGPGDRRRRQQVRPPRPPRPQGGATAPSGLADALKKHGVDLDKWKNGDWKNWDKDTWLREAKDFVNPVIEGLWKPDRMKSAKDPQKTMAAGDATGGTRASPTRSPRPSRHTQEKTALPPVRGPGRQGLLRLPRGLHGVLRHRRQGPGPPRQVQPGVDRGPLRPRRAGPAAGTATSPSSPPTTTRASRRRQLNNATAAADRPLRRLLGGLGLHLQRVDQRRRPDRRPAPRTTTRSCTSSRRTATKSLEETVGNALTVDFYAPAAETSARWAPGATRRRRRTTACRCSSASTGPGRLSLISPARPRCTASAAP